MSQRSLERQPLMDVGNLSQATDSGEAKKMPVPAVSTTSQVIDLCTEGDMTFAFNQSVLPVGNNKSKTKAPAKPRVTAPKPATAKPKAPAAKKAKKSKVEVEFDKLSPLEQLEFLRSKAQLLEQLELDPSVQNATTAETVEAPVTTSANVANSDDMQLCTLRLELGAVLSSEAELRAKERKIRLQIKRLHRKMTLALPPIVVTHKETVPKGSIADALFVAPSFAGSIIPPTGAPERAEVNMNLSRSSSTVYRGMEALQSLEKPLWRLAQQDEQFDYAVAPRLLSVERDAVLLPELRKSLAPLSPPVPEKMHSVETPHSPEQDTLAVVKSPIVSPYVVQTEAANDIGTTDMCDTSDICVDENVTGSGLLATFAADNNNVNIDIYEMTSSNESNAGDADDVMNDCNINEDATSTVAVSHNQDSRHIASDEHRNKRQKVHSIELSSKALATVRTGLFANNYEESVPDATQAVLTQPHGNNNTNSDTDGVIDLCSPELGAQSSKPSSRPSAASQIDSRAEAGTSHAAISTTANLSSTTTTNTTSATSLNILTCTSLPDFSTMSIAQIREIVQYYGLKEDTRPKMTSLLRAMWCRVHGKKTSIAIARSASAGTEVRTAHSSTSLSSAEQTVAPIAPSLPPQSIDVTRNTQRVAQPVPQLPQPSSQHQLLVSSYLTQSLTANTLSTISTDSMAVHCTTAQNNNNSTSTSTSTSSSTSSSSSEAAAMSSTTTSTTTTTATVATTTATATVSTKTTTATRFELTLADLKQFIRNHETLYQQVLQYTPIELDTVHASIVSTGVFKVSRTKLLEMLDSLAIFVSNTNNRNGNNNGKGGKGKKRKQLSQSSV